MGFGDGFLGKKLLNYALGLNIALVVGLFFAAYFAHSFVIAASAVHQLVDTAGIAITIVALKLSVRPPTKRHSFGLVRAEVLAALTNSVLLGIITLAVLASSVIAMFSDLHPNGEIVSVTGLAGLGVNLLSLYLLSHRPDTPMSVKSTALHLLADSISWMVAVVTGVVVSLTHLSIFDPIGSVVVSLYVLVSTWKLITRTLNILLEASPENSISEEMSETLLANPYVSSVHHLHTWNLSSLERAVSAHVVLENISSLHQAELVVFELKELLRDQHDITHATLEVECHPCPSTEHETELGAWHIH
ncbi:cation diffusion facilitator family transporter [Ferrithrix thermotolerans]|uniref:cation diffusion facilitator family transporter n=1 Tax=Ferrithrix thermotolerans TaxID=209649 RepID=UPI000933517A|nr:cation diffusion facilitator family transporter [Ferrithrix thermotolerans]